MNRIILCSILVNESQTERQFISWDEDDHLLYSSTCDEPVDGYEYETMEDAVSACATLWVHPVWGLQWYTYRVKPEFYDFWGAYEGADDVTVDTVAQLAIEWETALYTLFQQLEVRM